jgi:hypothetical protein
MLKPRAFLLLPLFLLPLQSFAVDCELEAQLDVVRIQKCDGERFLGTAGDQDALADRVPFDVIPHGLEKFWSDLCDCYLWQISGIAGAHTHVARFYQIDDKGRLMPIPGGEFGSEIGKISRISERVGFTVEVLDSDISGKRKTWERYRFDGKKFVSLRTRK